jgi:myo-inositol-1(or 4)-monophosphatase
MTMNDDLIHAEAEREIAGDELVAIEQLAAELATLAGAEIFAALGRMHAVRYKATINDESSFRDPVSEVDHRVETLIRARLFERFAEHDIIGEEIDERTGRTHDFVWCIDPIDGTTNFVNGFPLFAASIGVLHRGRPVVGAVWCTTSHRLRAGVYHARAGGQLCFDGIPAMPIRNPAVRRGLAGVPGAGSHRGPWDGRKTGSAALECAFVAAGLLRVASFKQPNIWDVAGGVSLVLAAGGEARIKSSRGWIEMEDFRADPDSRASRDHLRNWRGSIVVGDKEAIALICG